MPDFRDTMKTQKEETSRANELRDIIMQLSADFISLQPDLLRKRFEATLQSVAVALDADTCTLFLLNTHTDKIYADCNYTSSQYTADVDTNINDSGVIWIVPVTYNYGLTGYLQVITCEYCMLSQEISDLLKLLTSLIANILQHMKSEAQQQNSDTNTQHGQIDVRQFKARLSNEGVILDADQSLLDFDGESLVEIRGRSFWDIRSWSNSNMATEKIKHAILMAGKGRLVQYSTFLADDTGSFVQLELSLQPERELGGSVKAIVLEAQHTKMQRPAKSTQQYTELAIASPGASFYCSTASENKIIVLEPIVRKLLTNALHHRMPSQIPIIRITADGACNQMFVTLFYNQPQPDFDIEQYISKQESNLPVIRFQHAIPNQFVSV